MIRHIRRMQGTGVASMCRDDDTECGDGVKKPRPEWPWFLRCVVGAVDRHSNKSALVPPTLSELVKLTQQARGMQSDAAPVEKQDAPVRRLRRRLSPQQIEELVTRYNAGEDTPALSRAHGISRGGLRKLLLAQGVSFRKQPMTPEDVERATCLYENGMSIKQVVERVGYSFGTVRRMLHENGVAVRERGGRKRVPLEK